MKHSHTRIARTRRVLLAGSALLASGCASTPVLEVSPPPDAAYYAPATDSPRYVLQPGDTIAVTFHLVPRFDGVTKIRPDGYVSIAPVDEVKAAGLTLAELDDALTRTAADHMEDPDLTVSVSEFAAHKIYVGGEVRRGGIQELQDRMTPFQAIVQAGGAIDTAEMRQVIIIRNGDPEGRQVFGIDLSDDELTADTARQLHLQPFDVVYVPKSRIARMNQWVNQYIDQLIPIDFIGSAGINYVIEEGDSDATVTLRPGL